MKAIGWPEEGSPISLQSHISNETAVPLVFGFVQVCDLPASRYIVL